MSGGEGGEVARSDENSAGTSRIWAQSSHILWGQLIKHAVAATGPLAVVAF